MTLLQLKQLFENIGDSHLFINTTEFGDYPDYADKTVYPAFYPALVETETLTNTVNRTFNLIVCDLVHTDRSNLDQVLSDTEQTLNDIIKVLRQESDYYTLINNPTLKPFRDSNEDGVAGYEVTVVIETLNNNGYCDLPMTAFGLGNVSGSNGVPLVSFDCSDVAACPVVLGLSASIDSLIYQINNLPVINFGNGLTYSGGVARLGGTLVNDTSINGYYNLNFGNTSKLSSFNVSVEDSFSIKGSQGSNDIGIFADPSSNEINMYFYDNASVINGVSVTDTTVRGSINNGSFWELTSNYAEFSSYNGSVGMFAQNIDIGSGVAVSPTDPTRVFIFNGNTGGSVYLAADSAIKFNTPSIELMQNTLLQLGGYSLSIDAGNTLIDLDPYNNGNVSGFKVGNNYINFDGNSDYVELGYGNLGINRKGINIDNQGARVFAGGAYASTFKGLEYGADYSANYSSRSLVDKGYVTSNFQTSLGYTPENIANKGVANGYVPLNSTTKIDPNYLPSYVDDVEEYSSLSVFPVTGETGKIYVALNTNKIYRWSGSTYLEISASAFTGAINANQVGYGTGTNTIGGSNNFTYNGSILALNGDVNLTAANSKIYFDANNYVQLNKNGTGDTAIEGSGSVLLTSNNYNFIINSGGAKNNISYNYNDNTFQSYINSGVNTFIINHAGVFGANRLGINTSSPNYHLDVNGTASIPNILSKTITLTGFGNTSTTNSLSIKNSSNQFMFLVRDDKKVFIGTDPVSWDSYAGIDASGIGSYMRLPSFGVLIDDSYYGSWSLRSLGSAGSSSFNIVHNGVGEIVTVNDIGLGVGLNNAQPEAVLHLKRAANGAFPAIKIAAGTLLYSTQDGAIEYDGNKFYGTTASLNRYAFTQNDSNLLSGRIPYMNNGVLSASSILTFNSSNGTMTVGTISSGVWNGSSISTTYTDAKIKGTIGTQSGVIPFGTGTADTVQTNNFLQFYNSGSNSQIRITNSSGNSQNAIVFSEDINNPNATSGIVRYGGNYTATYWSGTTIPIASGLEISSGNFNQKIYMAGSAVFQAGGYTSTNMGTRLDATGFRIDAISNLHTANSYKFSVDNNRFRYETNSSSYTQTMLTNVAGTGTVALQADAGASYLIGLSTGGFYIDASTNTPMGLRTYSAKPITFSVNTTTQAMQISGTGLVSIGNFSTSAAYLDIASSTSAIASLRIRAGATVSAPNNGDMWNDGTYIWHSHGIGVTNGFIQSTNKFAFLNGGAAQGSSMGFLEISPSYTSSTPSGCLHVRNWAAFGNGSSTYTRAYSITAAVFGGQGSNSVYTEFWNAGGCAFVTGLNNSDYLIGSNAVVGAAMQVSYSTNNINHGKKSYFGDLVTTPGAYIDITGATTSAASLRIRSGTAPTSPNNGDIWNDGSFTTINSPSKIQGTNYDQLLALTYTTGNKTVYLGSSTDGLTVHTSVPMYNQSSTNGTTWFLSNVGTGNYARLQASGTIQGSAIDFYAGNAGGTSGKLLLHHNYISNAPKIAVYNTGVAIGADFTPSASLHITAGTASAGTAPIKLTAGTNMTTPENGAFEFDGTNLYFTVGGVRKTVTLT